MTSPNSTRIVVIVQARTGSTRLPGKVLLPLAGAPLLVRMLERVRAARTPGSVVVATTVDRSDDPLEALCAETGVPCFRGDAADLLDRHYRAGLAHGADVVVKIPSDCPLIDPAVVDRVLDAYLADPSAYDFVSNLHPPSYPDGQDVEAMSMDALRTAWTEARSPMQREHTTPFIWDQPERFRIGNVTMEGGADYSMTHRWTVDYPEDYRFLAAVFDELYAPDRPPFGADAVLALLERRPDIAALNARYVGVNWYRNHLAELRTVDARMTRPVRPSPTEQPG